MRKLRLVAWTLLIGGIIVAAINGKYFGAYSDPPTGSIGLYILTIAMLSGGLIALFRTNRANS